MTRRRDVSGLWEGTDPDSTMSVDRSPGVGPPPRRPEPPEQPTANPTPMHAAPAPAAAAAPTSIGLAVVPTEAAPSTAPELTPEPEPVGKGSPSATIKTGLSFTADQIKWLNKTADRQEMWLGDVIAELLDQFGDQAAATPLPRRTRKRKGSNYTQLQVYLEPDDRAALDVLAEQIGRSRAALGRLLVDLASADS